MSAGLIAPARRWPKHPYKLAVCVCRIHRPITAVMFMRTPEGSVLDASYNALSS